MKFLDYLFFKYYHFQTKVGNSDIAPMMSVLFLCFIMEFYYLSIVSLYLFFVSSDGFSIFRKPYSIVIIYVVLLIVFYFLFLYKKRYNTVLKKHETEWKGKKSIVAIIFAVFPFIFFFLELYIKMLMNQGKL